MPYVNNNSFGETYGEHKRALELSKEDYLTLFNFSKQNDIDFTASGWDEESIDFLDELGVPFFKMASADITPETVSKTKMKPPADTWIFVRDGFGPFYIFDAANGEMQGLVSTTFFTPALEVNAERSEIYAAEQHYTRTNRGARTDVVTIFDLETLSPKAEIEVPKKVAALGYRQYIALMDDRKHLAVFNLTPAQSVSVVDIDTRAFVGEISTPGCALIMQTAGSGFLQMCGDGRLQLIRLDKNGCHLSMTNDKSL